MGTTACADGGKAQPTQAFQGIEKTISHVGTVHSPTSLNRLSKFLLWPSTPALLSHVSEGGGGPDHHHIEVILLCEIPKHFMGGTVFWRAIRGMQIVLMFIDAGL